MAWLTIDGVDVEVQMNGASEEAPFTVGKPIETADNGMLSTQRRIARVFTFTTGPVDDAAIATYYGFEAAFRTCTGEFLGGASAKFRVTVESAPFLPVSTTGYYRVATLRLEETLTP
jgi:hypothetical protein